MQKQLQLWQFIQEKLRSDIPVALLYVLESSGSSPGRQGFGMAVTAAGDMTGSIGGGMMEHKLVELAKTVFQSNQPPGMYHKQIHNKSAAKNQSGMICSGEQSVYIQLLSSSLLPDINSMINSLEKGLNGMLEITHSYIRYTDQVPETDYTFQFRTETDFIYQEKTGFRNDLYIVGGGHCALAFSKLMSDLDFRIHLMEERPQLNTLLKNEFAHHIILVSDYTEIGTHIPNNDSAYVVIMTFGYRTDAMAIRSLQQKKLAYLGMLGSRSKINTLMKEMKDEDLLSKFITPVRAPVGIPIYSQTPEEIAVSIAAEIIKVKNEKTPRQHDTLLGF